MSLQLLNSLNNELFENILPVGHVHGVAHMQLRQQLPEVLFSALVAQKQLHSIEVYAITTWNNLDGLVSLAQ